MIRRTAPALALDAVLVVLFAAIGRSSHHESGNAVTATLAVAAPFLGGLAFGWLMAWLAEHRPAVLLADGAVVWVATVAAGMTLRHLAGRGVAVSFVIVASVVLGVFLLGWRALNALAGRRTARR